MGYEKYTDPGSGYGPNTNPGGGYPTAAAPTYLTTPTPQREEVRDDFTALSIIRDGVGNYHLNHFIAYFAPPVNKSLSTIKFFYQNFCKIFSLQNVAVVVPERKRKFKGLDVVKFTIGGNIGDFKQQVFGRVHDDWVAMQMAKDGRSFYGTTLRRAWFEPADFWEAFAINTGSPKVGPPVSPILLEANRRHFLAGRRSWRLDYDNSLGLYYLETAAFERSSHVLYQAIEQTGVLRESITSLWTNQLENYPVTLRTIDAMNLLPTGDYEVKGNVAYMSGDDASAPKALLTDWFSPVLKRHPGLVTDL